MTSNKHRLYSTTPLFCILPPTCFGSSLPSSGGFLDPSEVLEIQIEWVVYHIMCGYVACVPDCCGSDGTTTIRRGAESRKCPYEIFRLLLYKLFIIFLNLLHIFMGAWWLSRYNDWLRVGRSGDRILVGARFFADVQTGPGVHPASCSMRTGSFPGVKWPGRGADHPPLLAPRSRMIRAIPLLPL
jgi:hypothetical protein